MVANDGGGEGGMVIYSVPDQTGPDERSQGLKGDARAL